MLKHFNYFKKFIVLLVLVFCFSKSAIGEDLCLRLPLGSYARINYAEYLNKGREVDSITKTIILTGSDAISFLLQTKQFQHQTTVCNLDTNSIVMELEGQSLTLGNIGAVLIKPGAILDFKKITGQVIVIITQQPGAVYDWYRDYNGDNFPGLFSEKGFNRSGIVSPEEWTNKGVTVIDSTGRKHQWTGEPETEWLTDSMALGANLVGVSMVTSATSTDNEWLDFVKIRTGEIFHRHPNKRSANFIEVYYIVEGMAALTFIESGKNNIIILRPGDMMIMRDGMPHTILALKGPYKHIAMQMPSVFQYQLSEFKEPVDFPRTLEELIRGTGLNELLNSI